MLRAIPLGIETVAEWLPGLMAGVEGLEPNQPELLESSALPVELYPYIESQMGRARILARLPPYRPDGAIGLAPYWPLSRTC